jgi:DNA-binding response OmpR family regulator
MARLLIVDDDPDILKMADRILSHAGHQVVTAGDALKAIDLLGGGGFDVLVSDANMPLYSGFELIQTVRANPRYEHLSVAMLTGLRERKDVEKAVRAGVDDYIVKPLDPIMLVQKINSMIEKRPPEKKPEIRLNPESSTAQAQMSVGVQLESISELGIVILTMTPLKVGDNVEISAAFLRQWTDKLPQLKVLSTEPTTKSGVTRVQLVFMGATESLLQKIRRWIFTHSSNHRLVG